MFWVLAKKQDLTPFFPDPVLPWTFWGGGEYVPGDYTNWSSGWTGCPGDPHWPLPGVDRLVRRARAGTARSRREMNFAGPTSYQEV
ncbi:hypothetical protein CATMQ487_18180 [Sphaerotilus microaerophilus]|uniref:Uncharacterized protein n=1 Tax=Sphaerotilus microaerophilus TaxID=2914710 RepID=A0ABM7YKC0_9BURK|nr:hypothetical protein CATMQ487_18180 [Sphaerotilus sp. FB-5]